MSNERATEAMMEAAEAGIAAGWDARVALMALANCWSVAIKERERRDRKTFDDACKPATR